MTGECAGWLRWLVVGHCLLGPLCHHYGGALWVINLWNIPLIENVPVP